MSLQQQRGARNVAVASIQLPKRLALLYCASMFHRSTVIAGIGYSDLQSLRSARQTEAYAQAAPHVYYWPLKNATNANGDALSYEERALALAFQGIVNANGSVGSKPDQAGPTVFFDAVRSAHTHS